VISSLVCVDHFVRSEDGSEHVWRPATLISAPSPKQTTMDHGGHGGHGEMDMPSTGCSMHMLWNTDRRPCILFSSIHVQSDFTFSLALAAIFLLAVSYEQTRLLAARHDRRLRFDALFRAGTGPGLGGRRSASPLNDTEEPLLGARSRSAAVAAARRAGTSSVLLPPNKQVVRSLFYTYNVAVSFILMLIVMSYNSFLISAVLAGAFVGHFVLHWELSIESDEEDKGMACH